MSLSPPQTVMWNGGTLHLVSAQDEDSNYAVFKPKMGDSPHGLSFVLFDKKNGKVNYLQLFFYFVATFSFSYVKDLSIIKSKVLLKRE